MEQRDQGVTIIVQKMKQNDPALRLLSQMYARFFMWTSTPTLLEAYETIRDILSSAITQQEAYEQLQQAVQASAGSENLLRQRYEQAQDLVLQVIGAGGNADTLIVGETDGFRHLCFPCSQDEQNFQRISFFQKQERRLLLKPEVAGERRSAYSKCQICLQPICPNKLVLFTFAGTEKHPPRCACKACNRAAIASLLTIYEYDTQAQQILFPFLQKVTAPSKRQCLQQAIKICWEKGWYMLNKDSLLP